MNTYNYRNYCEVDLEAIFHNFNQIKNIINNNVKVMGVVKADAYGHGAERVSEVLIKNGVDYLAVATIDEAMQIREKFDIPILNLGFVPDNQISYALENNITLTVFNTTIAQKISQCAQQLNKKAKVHIKIDTGMNRIGFLDSKIEEVLMVLQLPGLDIEGIFTHFSCAGTDSLYTQKQYELFLKVCNKISNYYQIKYKHCCNSSAIIDFPYMHMDMVRPGIIIYGLYPHTGIDKQKLLLKPAMSFKTKIIHLKNVLPDCKIGYDGNYITTRDSIIGTIPVGYADGYPRSLSNNASVLVNGQFSPVLGNICMDNCMIDVSEIQNVKILDEVVLFGRQGEKIISIDEIAKKLGTINYEIICSVGKRVPIIYKEINT